ncbi:MAG: TonB-dependent receptor [Polyangia bacterium]
MQWKATLAALAAAILVSTPLAAQETAVPGGDAGEERGGERSGRPDPDEPGHESDEPVFEPPDLVEYAAADYPPEAFEQGLEAEVLTRISIDASGKVTGVEVLEPVGHGFDEAAVEAIERFVFEPATRDGEPIPSQVLYRYTFFLREVEEEAAEREPPRARLSGVVRDMYGDPIAGAGVALVPLAVEAEKDAPTPEPVTADEQGRFELAELAPGSYQVDVVAAGYEPLSEVEELVGGEDRELLYRLEEESVLYETVVRGRRPPREVTRREVTRREITRIPGTGGDALRSVQNLPGMARAPGLGGQLIVRGSSPRDTNTYFDQMPVPLLYHFGGLTSVINSDLLERIDFYPGNYSVRYGGATGGIVDVYPRAPAQDRLHASLDADIWDISALVESPIGEDWSVAVSARRSYIDWVLQGVLPEQGGLELTMAPRYYDYQAIADYHPDEKDQLRLFVFGSDDRLVFVFGDDVAGNPNFGGGLDFTTLFHQIQLRWRHAFSGELENDLNFGTGYQKVESRIGEDYRFDLAICPLYLRDEIRWKPGWPLVVRTGIDAALTNSRFTIRAPGQFPQEGESFDPISSNDELFEVRGQQWAARPSWYGELELTAIERLRLIYGLRVDYYTTIEGTAVDPRFVARFGLFELTTLKGGIGLFHQPPEEAQVTEDFGNPELDLIGAVHYSLGVEQKLPDPLQNVEIGLEGFYKDIHSLVVSSERTVERGGEMVPERYNNDGVGQVWGMELMVKHQPTERFFGWIAYTLMRSQRIDHPGEDPRPFDYDQTHILTVVASAVLGRGWEAGLRFRLVSGNPETPVVGAAYDADSDIYWPIHGSPNSARLPAFHQLDLRVDKNWDFGPIAMAVYVDVQNIYNHQNVEGYQYNYDYSERVYFTGLPILPSLGFKLEY